MTIFNFGISENLHVIEGKTYKIKPYYTDLILSFIVKKMLTNELQFGYVDIPSIELKKTYDKYWVYIDFLKTKNVIQVRNHSDKHKRCKGYRFDYVFLEKIEIQSITLNKTLTTNSNTIDYPEIIPIEDQAMVSYQTIQRLKRDFESVEVKLDKIEKVRYEDSAYVDAPKYFRSLIQLHKLKEGGDFKKFEFKANRLYTNFSFISGFYRTRNILLNGETLVEFDVSSSFPVMFGIFALKINPEIIHDNDFVEYCTLLKSGKFYDNLTATLNLNLNSNNSKLKVNSQGFAIANRKLTRNNTKELFQKLLNGKKNRSAYIKGYSNPFIKDIFQMKFGCLNEILENLKSRGEKVYYKLSKLETEFIFSVVEELYNKISGIKILTLHDAIFVSKLHGEQVKIIWEENTKKLYDLLPDNYDNSSNQFLEEIGIFEEDFLTHQNKQSYNSIKPNSYENNWDDFFDDFIDDDDF